MQRTFTAKKEETQDLDYWERLSKLNLPDGWREEKYDIIYTRKMLEGIILSITEKITAYNGKQKMAISRQ